MKAKGTILFFSIVLMMWAGSARAAEYIAKEGDTWAKVCKATGNTVQQLAKMNKITEPKDSDPVAAGQKIVYLSSDDIECARKYCKKRLGEVSYGTGDYMKLISAKANLQGERFEYSAEARYPYGIRFNEVIELADKYYLSKKSIQRIIRNVKNNKG